MAEAVALCFQSPRRSPFLAVSPREVLLLQSRAARSPRKLARAMSGHGARLRLRLVISQERCLEPSRSALNNHFLSQAPLKTSLITALSQPPRCLPASPAPTHLPNSGTCHSFPAPTQSSSLSSKHFFQAPPLSDSAAGRRLPPSEALVQAAESLCRALHTGLGWKPRRTESSIPSHCGKSSAASCSCSSVIMGDLSSGRVEKGSVWRLAGGSAARRSNPPKAGQRGRPGRVQLVSGRIWCHISGIAAAQCLLL